MKNLTQRSKIVLGIAGIVLIAIIAVVAFSQVSGGQLSGSVSQVTISPANPSIFVKETKTLSTGNATCTWSTSSQAITLSAVKGASIVVTGRSAGTATIGVTCSTGNASTIVTVKNPPTSTPTVTPMPTATATPTVTPTPTLPPTTLSFVGVSGDSYHVMFHLVVGSLLSGAKCVPNEYKSCHCGGTDLPITGQPPLPCSSTLSGGARINSVTVNGPQAFTLTCLDGSTVTSQANAYGAIQAQCLYWDGFLMNSNKTLTITPQ